MADQYVLQQRSAKSQLDASSVPSQTQAGPERVENPVLMLFSRLPALRINRDTQGFKRPADTIDQARDVGHIARKVRLKPADLLSSRRLQTDQRDDSMIMGYSPLPRVAEQCRRVRV